MPQKYFAGLPIPAAPQFRQILTIRRFPQFEEGRYWAVVGNRPADGSGSILLFESADALHWRFASVLASCHNQFGKMWECPDFFPLDGRYVLLTSPQDMTSMGLEFHPGNSTLCIVGEYDRERRHLLRDNIQAIDYGTDFYATQTVLAKDGERVTLIRHKPESNTMRVDRSRSGFPHDIVNQRDFPVAAYEELKQRIILDRYSLELFVNDGEQAASFVLYTPLSADSISFSCDGAAIIDVEKYDLEISQEEP